MTPWESPGGPDKLRMAPLSFLKKRHFHGSQWFWKMRISLPQPYGNLSFQKICLTLKFRTLKVSVKIQIWGKSPMHEFRRLQKSHGVWDFGSHSLLKTKISKKRLSAWKSHSLRSCKNLDSRKISPSWNIWLRKPTPTTTNHHLK